MKKAWRAIGILLFWLTWPALVLYLNRSERARILVVCGNEVLLLKTWLGTGKWGLPGGGLHAGESPIKGALREAREETSLDLNKAELKTLFSAPYTYSGFRYPCHYFVADLDHKPPLKTQKFEITDAVWIDYRKLTAKNSKPDTLTAVAAWFVA